MSPHAPRKVLLDDLILERDEPALPPEPELTIQPVDVDAQTNGRRGSRRRLGEIEEIARRNARAAEEALHAALAQRGHLEAEIERRRLSEQEVGALRREAEHLREAAAHATAQVDFTAERLAREIAAREVARVGEEHVRLQAELAALRTSVDDYALLASEHMNRLRLAHKERDEALARADGAEVARGEVESQLAAAVDSARARAEEQAVDLANAREAVDAVTAERDGLAEELRVLVERRGDSEARIGGVEARAAERVAAAEARAAEQIAAADARVSDVEERAAERLADVQAQLADAEARVADAEARVADADAEIERLLIDHAEVVRRLAAAVAADTEVDAGETQDRLLAVEATGVAIPGHDPAHAGGDSLRRSALAELGALAIELGPIKREQSAVASWSFGLDG